MIQFMYPTGHSVVSMPLRISHSLVSAPHPRSNASTSSGVLVRSAEMYPSNAKTNGMMGMMHEKKKVRGDLQRHE